MERHGELVIVAPEGPVSGCSHLTTTNRHLTASTAGVRHYAIDGTPVDCVRVGLFALAPDVEWVVSGINDGGNLGVDIYMSGTVAAAREAALLGKHATAFSHYRTGRQPIDWERAVDLVQRVLEQLPADPGAPPGYWNVNLPDTMPDIKHPEVIYCEPDPHPLPMRFVEEESGYRFCGDYHGRPRRNKSDVDVCFAGHIAVSYITLRVG